jgi:sugar lactone lactonase YvrE
VDGLPVSYPIISVKKWFGKMLRRILILIALVPLLVGVSCRETDTTETPPIKIAGTNRSLRVRCVYQSANNGDSSRPTYDVTCTAVGQDDSGSEAPIVALADGMTIDWQPPTYLQGEPVVDSSCSIFSGNLSQRCQITLAGNTGTKIQFDAKISDSLTGDTHTESDVVYLPITARSFGIVVQAPRQLVLPTSSQSVDQVGLLNPGIPATSVSFGSPKSMCLSVDRKKVFLATTSFIYEYSIANATMRIFAGSPSQTSVEDLQSRFRIRLNAFSMVCVEDGVVVADQASYRLLKIPFVGPVEILALYRAPLSIVPSLVPVGLAKGGDGRLYFADLNTSSIRVFDLATRTTSLFAGGVGGTGSSTDDGPLAQARFSDPQLVSTGPDSSLLVVETNGRIRQIKNGMVRTFPRRPTSTGGILGLSDGRVAIADRATGEVTAIDAAGVETKLAGGLSHIELGGLLEMPDHSVWVCDGAATRVYKILPHYLLQPMIGGESTFSPGPAEKIQMQRPQGLYFAADGTLYVADLQDNRLIKIVRGPDGASTASDVVSGSESFPLVGGGLGTRPILKQPWGIAEGRDGALYVTESGGNRVRRVVPSTGAVTTVVGGGDGSLLNTPLLDTPMGIAFDSKGVLYVADSQHGRIVKINSDSTLTTIAGLGAVASPSDGPVATTGLPYLAGLAVLPDDSLIVGESYGTGFIQRITRKVNGDFDQVVTLAGAGNISNPADGTEAQMSRIESVSVVSVAPDGKIYFLEAGMRIRYLAPYVDARGNTRYKIFRFNERQQTTDCGSGVVRRRSSGDEVRDYQASLASMCSGYLTTISNFLPCTAARPFESFAIGQGMESESSVTVGGPITQIAQLLRSGNVISLERACAH